jgi:hypothetical protein
MATTFGPAAALPICSQFLRLCSVRHKRNYAQVSVMRISQPAPRDRMLIIRAEGGPPAFAVSA